MKTYFFSWGLKASPFEKGGLRGIYKKDIFLTVGSGVTRTPTIPSVKSSCRGS
jgi:hypothetical protein